MNRAQDTVSRCGLALAGVLLAATLLQAQNIATNRPYEPYIMPGSVAPNFSNNTAPIAELCMMRYDAALDQWQAVPFQVDQRTDDLEGSFFSGSFDGLLDDNDELVWMVASAGDQAPFNVWVDDAEARSNPRFEFVMSDPLDPAVSGYLYLYRSSTLDKGGVGSLMSYTPPPPNSSADIVAGSSYEETHSATNGLPVGLRIETGAGGLSADLLDRVKLRIRGLLLNFFPITPLNEDNFRSLPERLKVVTGPVRVIREIENEILFGTTAIDTAAILIKFYPYSVILSASIPLQSTSTFSFTGFRLSIDLAATANGMRFYRHDHANNDAFIRAIVDGINDTFNRSVLTSPDVEWDMVTGNDVTFVKLSQIDLSQLNNAAAAYYYHESRTGSTDDGSADTGDGFSYADAGVNISNTGGNITGIFPIFLQNVLVPGAQDSTFGVLLRDQTANPTGLLRNEQNFDAVPPASVALAIVDSTETSVTLGWIAPGNDGDGNGAAQQYTLYYSTTAPGADIDAWAMTVAEVDTDLPAPAQPGTPQQYTVTDLTPQIDYYFVLTTSDAFGNTSAYSNIATAFTVPVELALFSARADGPRVHLSWRTESETNNAGFAVERRAQDATATWLELGFIAGNGTTAQPQEYEYVDRIETPGIYLYRLRQMDYDGTFEHSPVIEVNVLVPSELQLAQNYPNPFQSGAVSTISYVLPARENPAVALKVFNVLGQEVATLVQAPQGAGYYQLSWNGLTSRGERVAPGLYFLILEADQQRLVRKISILR